MNVETRIAYSIDSAVEVTDLTRTRIYRAIADGSLKSFKMGRRRMVTAAALKAFIALLERQSAGQTTA